MHFNNSQLFKIISTFDGLTTCSIKSDILKDFEEIKCNCKTSLTYIAMSLHI